MNNPYVVGSIDVAELSLAAFFLFFVALVFWLRREDRREGYPLEHELTGRIETVGGPLSIVETGDLITLDVEARQLTLHVDDAEIQRRLAARPLPAPHYTRGYGKLFLDHVTQAHLGCDFDFLHAEKPNAEKPNE
jgi:hypothetical protein